ncbi:hypothetical protein ABTU21_003825 [Escherichia coli]|uniref:hypothetical protein n=1 Tax=Escherichia coli TaxID=562 RepID=UPI001E601366|nr:hypothetical protein [Escherichia coli]MCC5019182.1 hypothetical protein [Escherichia coli]HBK2958891.1 hypothetical protein [Escherichia coli]
MQWKYLPAKRSHLRGRLPEIKTTDSEVSDESDIHSIMLEKSAKAESKAQQAIKDAKAEVIDQAIQLLRKELRSGKLEGMMMPYQRGYLSAISKLEVLKSEL